MTLNLSAERAHVYRITHIDNVPYLLANGIHCRSSGNVDPNFREIGNPDLIDKRKDRVVPISPGGTLSDYVPFYFTPCSPMLFNIKTGFNGLQQRPMSEIVILVTSLRKIAADRLPFVFTDRHAYLEAARYSSDLSDLNRIDWKRLQARDFKRDPDDPGKFERYQAEALIHGKVPVSSLVGLACSEDSVKDHVSGLVSTAGVSLQVITNRTWFFQ